MEVVLRLCVIPSNDQKVHCSYFSHYSPKPAPRYIMQELTYTDFETFPHDPPIRYTTRQVTLIVTMRSLGWLCMSVFKWYGPVSTKAGGIRGGDVWNSAANAVVATQLRFQTEKWCSLLVNKQGNCWEWRYLRCPTAYPFEMRVGILLQLGITTKRSHCLAQMYQVVCGHPIRRFSSLGFR